MADTDLNQLLNTPRHVALSTGAEIDVSAIMVAEMSDFIESVVPLFNGAGEISLMSVVISHPRELIKAVRIGARLSEAEMNALAPDDLLELASVIIEVNADFFVKRILPKLQGRMASLGNTLAGLISSSASLQTDTSGPT